MTALLTDNLPLLAGAPNGIKKLRELILELAVRGKLVPQDLSDEPACEILKRIAEEKARLVVEGAVKKQKPSMEIDIENQAYKLPIGWAWVRLSDVVRVLNGRAYKKEELLDVGVPVLRVGNLFTSNHWYYSDLILEEDKYCHPGDLLFAWSASFGPFIWSGERSIYHYHIWKLDFYAEDHFNKSYLYNVLLEQTREIKASGHGVSMVHMTKEKMEKLVVPVPPLSEQYRIVAKIDELMALCDRLEGQQADAESAHTQLVQALLDSLIRAVSVTDFAANWQRLSKHFHTLFTTEPSIDALKQTLLCLAVMGKLTPQQAYDEPVDELIGRVAAEKKRLMAEEGLRTTASENVEESEHYIQLSSGWRYCRLGNLARFIDYRGRTPTKTSSGIPLITAKNVRVGFISREPQEFIAETDYSTWMTRGFPRFGDMLFTTEAPMGNVALIDIAERFALAQRVICFQLHEPKTGPFLKLVIMSPFFQRQLLDVATGMTATGIKSARLKEIPVPLPPLSEQHRIVAKVDQLMTLCEQLKVQLAQKRLLNEKLAAVLVARTLMDGGNASNASMDKGSARVLLAAEIVHQLHCEKRMGRVKLQKIISLAEHVARLREIQSEEERYAAGPHDPLLMKQVEEGLRSRQWFDEVNLDGGRRHEYLPLAEAGAHRADYEALWSIEQRQHISQLIELVRPWDTAQCERVSTLYSAWNDLLIEGREVTDTAILHEVLQGWHDSKKKFTEEVWMSDLAKMKTHAFLVPTGFGERTRGGIRSLI